MTGIIVSVNSTIDLYYETKREGLKYQLTTRENQDSLENLFSNLRAMGGGNSHPSPVETANRIRKLCVYKNVSFVLDSANVEQSDQGCLKVLLNLFYIIFTKVLTGLFILPISQGCKQVFKTPDRGTK